MKTKFIVSNRVTRLKDVFRKEGRNNPLLHGTIIEVYSDNASRFGPYPELYRVKWDNNEGEEGGFLPHGLDYENKN